jgi:hypothetical protein
MKGCIKILVLAVVVLGFASSSFGQNVVSATATSSATIVSPLAIAKNVDLSFGNIAVQSNAGGTVLLDPSLAATRTPSGGVTLPAVTGTVTAAKFTVTGEGSYQYHIALPGSAITLSDGNSHTMSLGDFTSTPSVTGTLSSGSQIVYVGGTLTVTAGQTPGTYTNAAGLVVTINYN